MIEDKLEEKEVLKDEEKTLKAESPIVIEEPKVEELENEEPKVEEPKVEEPKIEEPKVEEPKVEEPTTRGTKQKVSEDDPLFPLKVSTPDLSVVSAVFGRSEEEIELEFKAFKATELFSKFDFDSTGANGDEEVKSRAEECKKYGFGSIIVLPQYISVAKKSADGKAEVIGAVSFPYGEEIPYSTVRSAKKAAEKGADALLIPVGVSFIKRGEYEKIKKTFRKIIKKTKTRVIAALECGSLTIEEAERAVKALSDAGVKEFRASTGFKLHDDEFMNLKSMRSALKNGNRVTASANGTSYPEVIRLLTVADRVSSRSAVYIADEIKEELNLK